MSLIAKTKGEAPNTTLAISITQPKHYSVAFDDRARKLHSDNVSLIAKTKGEAPKTTLVILITKPKPYSVAFDGRAGKLHSDNVRLIDTLTLYTLSLTSLVCVYAGLGHSCLSHTQVAVDSIYTVSSIRTGGFITVIIICNVIDSIAH